MHVTVEPPLEQWQLSPEQPADAAAVAALVGENADRLGTGRLESERVIATGHQAWLWHPGILAKDLAAVGAGRRLGAELLHVVVDHDAQPALNLELPSRAVDRLSVENIVLGREQAGVPTSCQPPVEAKTAVSVLAEARRQVDEPIAAGLDRLSEAWRGLPACRTLAEQVSVVLWRLVAPWTGALPLMFSSQLQGMGSFQDIVRKMAEDAERCVRSYNEACAAAPEAHLVGLGIEAERIELPLWSLSWGAGRQRVFAEIGGRRRLVLANGQEAKPRSLVPRALLLTAFARERLCSFFIHGRGGAVYERAAELWWSRWRGQALAPMAMVSADLQLDFPVPVGEPRQLRRAQWMAHHLPHNLDRVLPLDGPQVQRKRELLAAMEADRDRRRRGAAFQELHAINRELAQAHQPALHQARQELARARAGVANRAIAAKRDWSVALYPQEDINRLAAGLGVESP